jgi:hypothetical protein
MSETPEEIGPEKQAFLDGCKGTAQHMADVVETLVFDMLAAGGATADALSPSARLGVIVGPLDLIMATKIAMMETLGEMGLNPNTKTWERVTRPRKDPDDPCPN